jgi:hypothetical protein
LVLLFGRSAPDGLDAVAEGSLDDVVSIRDCIAAGIAIADAFDAIATSPTVFLAAIRAVAAIMFAVYWKIRSKN